MGKKLLLIFVLAFLIRLINLNQSLWLDEATTARVVQQYNFLEILAKFSPFDFHPPLYYWLIKLWTNIFGYSEISLRMPSIFFSLLAGYVVYLIGKLVANEKAGFWSAVFFLFNPLIIYYSQEARQYMMVTFFLTVALYYFIRTQSSPLRPAKRDFAGQAKLKNFILMNIFLGLSFLTFYGSMFFISAILIYLLIKKQYKLFLFSSICYLSSIILFSPLLYQQLVNAKVSLLSVTNWSLVLGKANLKNLLLIPVKFLIGRIDFYPKWLYYIVAGGWTGFILYQISPLRPAKQDFAGQAKLKNINLFYYLFIFPLILGFIVSFFTPLLQYFRFIYLIPIMSLSLGFQLQSRSAKWLVVAGFLSLSLVYLLLPRFHREDWKSLANSIPRNETIYMIKPSSDPLVYYLPNINVIELRDLESQQFELPNELTIIPYVSEIYGIDYKQKLSDYTMTNRYDFRGVYYEIWVKN